MRHVARTAGAFGLSILQTFRPLVGGDIERALILIAAIDSDAASTAVSALALSQSLGLARETTRTKVTRMTADGILTRGAHGVRPSPAFLASESYAEVRRRCVAQLEDMVGHLAKGGSCGLHPSDTLAVDTAYGEQVAFGVALQAFLRIIGRFRADLNSGSAVTDFVYAYTAHMATWHLSEGESIRFRATEEVAPDGLRREIKISDLARHVDLPRETVRRHLRAIQGPLALTERRVGFTVSQETSRLMAAMAWPALISQDARLLVAQLRRAGLIIARPGS